MGWVAKHDKVVKFDTSETVFIKKRIGFIMKVRNSGSGGGAR